MKELFIFGAGASNASGGAPLGKDLVWNYFEDCSTFYEIGNNGRPLLSDIEAKKAEFINFGRFLKTIEAKFPGILPHSEWERCMNETLMYTPKIEKKYYIDEVMEFLQKEQDIGSIDLIRRVTLEHITKTTYTSQNLLYKKFVEHLKGKAVRDVSIISFNFDSLLHEDPINQVYFDYLMDFKDIARIRSLAKKEEGIPFMKLNGSLDWAWNPKDKEISLLSFYMTDRSYSFSLDASDKEAYREPYIFLPHQKKSGAIELLWVRAKDEIRATKKLIVIGYSFPAYDKDVINLFRENLDSTAEVVVVDFDYYHDKDSGRAKKAYDRIFNYYRYIFPQISKVDISLDGFKGYVERLS